jgi:Fic family protein
MIWNWQKPDWPEFTWDVASLRRAEEQFLLGCGSFVGTVKHLDSTDREQITIEAMSQEALTSSEIEGELLDRASVQSSIRRQLGLGSDKRRVKPAERGIAELVVDLYRSFARPLTEGMLFGWHRMLVQGRSDLRDVGRYRRDEEAMQVVSGGFHSPKVHFEAPPSAQVPDEMGRFIDWFNRTAPGGVDALPALTRAGIAHLYFESIHPFEDGNGRIGRAISEKALAQSVGQPTLTALAATILIRRKEYYAALEAANQGNEITLWLNWFAGIVIEAQSRSAISIEFLIEKTKLLDRLRNQLNERQEKALLRILREGPEGFEGGLSAGNYAAITGAAPATATRDLADMVAKGALLRRGEGRYTRYFANLRISSGEGMPLVPKRMMPSGSIR